MPLRISGKPTKDKYSGHKISHKNENNSRIKLSLRAGGILILISKVEF